MYIWKISQNVNNDYETYDSAVVCAETENDARSTHPDPNWEDYASYIGDNPNSQDNLEELQYARTRSWACIHDVKVEYIGDAHSEQKTPGVILASYRAG